MKSKGFTLYELLITLAITCITLTIAIPSFNKQISQSRTKTATLTLLDAIETTRSTAVFRNKRIALLAKDKKWHLGWSIFSDNNNNGTLDGDEEVLAENGKLQGVLSIPKSEKSPINTYVSFIGTGEGRQAGRDKGGFLSGTIQICPEQEGDGYALILSKGGRTRVEKLKTEDCTATRK